VRKRKKKSGALPGMRQQPSPPNPTPAHSARYTRPIPCPPTSRFPLPGPGSGNRSRFGAGRETIVRERRETMKKMRDLDKGERNRSDFEVDRG